MKTNILQTLINSSLSTISSTDNNIEKKISTNQDIKTTLENKGVQTILKGLLNDLVSKNKSTKNILEILKNEPIFKEFKSFSGELKSLMALLDKLNVKSDITSKLKTHTVNIKNIDDKILKENISKSGIFLESYLKTFVNKLNINNQQDNLKQTILDDVKTILLQLKEEFDGDSEVSKQNIKLLNQIDYYQLLSATNFSNHTYLPFEWENLENGDISFKQDKDNFSCQIYLELQHYGDIKINMIFTKNNTISLSFFTQKEKMKDKLQINLKELRKMLKKIDIKIENIYVFDLVSKDINSKEIEAFTVYNNHIGVDIKA